MDRLMLGLSTTAIGMLVVFFGLVILILCISGMTLITARKKKEKASPKAEIPAQQEMAPAPAEAPAQEENDEQLIAVITAAIAAVWQNEEQGFVVRRIKRNQSSTPRARAARDEQIFSRL
ncbi:MAG: sodium pump decarboxylase subunit gamma [Clostridiales bacterium]|nr:sodium pump decarboxylase subunit gamma [Clostridiales bacterium]